MNLFCDHFKKKHGIIMDYKNGSTITAYFLFKKGHY